MSETETITFKDQLLEHFEQQISSLPGNKNLRRAAAKFFQEQGFPTRKWEDYKYVNPESILKKGFSFRTDMMRGATENDVKEFTLIKNSIVLVIVNGKFIPELSHNKEFLTEITAASLGEALESNSIAKEYYSNYAKIDSDPFIALNTALSFDGAFIHIGKNISSEVPIQIIHISDNEIPSFFQPRNLIVVEEGASAVVIETYESIGPVKTFTNALTEVFVAPNAKLDHYRIQSEGEAGQQMNTLQSGISENSLYNTFTFTFGGNFVRNNLNIVFNGKNGEAHLFGLYPLVNSQIVDNHTIVDHTVPNCMSNELFKGVINDKATAVFNGKIFVRPDAQKTNAYQTNRNILLSDDASVYTKPQLEIYADDVKCSHGTSTGRMDEDAMFYLQARGIGKESARALLIRAFAEEVVDQIKIDELRDYVDSRIDEILK